MLLINKALILLSVFALISCGESEPARAESSPQQSVQEPATGDNSAMAEATKDIPAPSEAERIEISLAELEDQMGIDIFKDPWTGDFDTIVEQRVIRVLTVYGLGRYFLDGGREKGLTYEFFKMFEEFVNKKMATKNLRIHVVFIPVARDQLLPGLISGRGDIAAAGLTITPERGEIIDFTDPISRTLSEVLVTGPTAPEIKTIDDLSGQQLYLRASSSYRASVDALNASLSERGLEEVDIQDAPELLEDEDLLEMVNAGLLQWAVVDDYKAGIWADVYKELSIRKDLVLRSGGRVGLAIRQDSPQLMAVLNEFLKTHKQGTLKGNILINRYLKNADWAKNALSPDEFQRFQDVVEIFLKFGDQYGVDYLMVAAQGYQESGLNQNAKSKAGAIGIMQLLPSTAADPNVGIPDISAAEDNIHAGVKYLDFIRNRYFSDSDMDHFNQTMFAFAAYNAGPARVRKLREKAVVKGYDPNLWFDNVEVIAAQEIGRETVQYVANILKYYVAYSLTIKQQLERKKARESVGIDSDG